MMLPEMPTTMTPKTAPRETTVVAVDGYEGQGTILVLNIDEARDIE